jgi:multisubunit Na+/H+ antiporter MnhE subunit
MVILTLIYSLVLESRALPDLLTGFVLSGVLIYLFRAHLFSDLAIDIIESFSLAILARRLFYLPIFLYAVAVDITKGSLQVAKVVLHLAPLPRSGFIYFPMGERSHLGVLVSALVLAVSPGSVPVRLDWEERRMLFHIFDASDPDTIRRDAESFYYRFQKRIFP